MKIFYPNISALSVFKKIMLITLILAASIATNTFIAVTQLNQMQQHLNQLRNTTYKMVLLASGNLPLLKRADELLVQSISSGDTDLIDQANTTLGELFQNLKLLKELDPGSDTLLTEIERSVGHYQNISKRVLDSMSSVDPDFDEITQDTRKKARIFEGSNQKLEDYHTRVAELFKATLDNAALSGRQSLFKTSLVNGISLLSLVLIIFWIARSISHSAIKVKDSLAELAKGSGDLTKRLEVKGKDELAQVAANFNLFADKLSQTVNGIFKLVPPLTQTSVQLDQASSEVSKATDNLLEKARVGKHSMEEMTLSINEISASAAATSDAINTTNQQANIGLGMVENTISNSEALNRQIHESSSLVHQLIEDTRGVAQILDMISQIAEQTNLLALNAAIEAARAGDLGRGFAVVADEVRALSLKTGDATRNIRTVLERLENNASRTMGAMEKATVQSSSTEKQALETGDALRNIITQIEEIKAMGLTIASATEEQSSVVLEVTLSISEMLEAVLSAEDANNKTQDLSRKLLDTSSELKTAISIFKVKETEKQK